jgi:hypothetical protein
LDEGGLDKLLLLEIIGVNQELGQGCDEEK